MPRGEALKRTIKNTFAFCFNPRPRLPRGEAGGEPDEGQFKARVSIHAPGCPGAKQGLDRSTVSFDVVSIHAPGCPGAKRPQRHGRQPHDDVSIHAPGCPGAKPPSRRRRRGIRRRFNPRPRLPRGEALCGVPLRGSLEMFQSTPPVAQGRSETVVLARDQIGVVSIHAPGCPGAKPSICSSSRTSISFQSTPPVAQGRSADRRRHSSFARCFNPRPRLPRGEASRTTSAARPTAVSIHAPGCPGAKLQRIARPTSEARFQSTPPVAQGRSSRAMPRERTSTGFNPRPRLPRGEARACA